MIFIILIIGSMLEQEDTMPNKDILNILNRLKNATTNESDNIKVILTKEETIELCEYLKELRKQHQDEKELILELYSTLLKHINKG